MLFVVRVGVRLHIVTAHKGIQPPQSDRLVILLPSTRQHLWWWERKRGNVRAMQEKEGQVKDRKENRRERGDRWGRQVDVCLKYSDKASSIPLSSIIFSSLYKSKKSYPPTDSPRSCHHCEEEASLPTAHNTCKHCTNAQSLSYNRSLPSVLSLCKITYAYMVTIVLFVVCHIEKGFLRVWYSLSMWFNMYSKYSFNTEII